MSRYRIRTATARLSIKVGQAADSSLMPSGVGRFTVSGQDSTITSGGAAGGVVYDLNSDTELGSIIVGDFPGTHGLHVDHNHPARWFGAATKVAIADGDWSDAAIWSPSGVPTTGDIVHVPSRLSFDATMNTKLVWRDTFAVNDGGELVIDYSASDFTCDLVLADTAIDTDDDPYQWGHGLLAVGSGKMTIKGKAKTPWGRLAAEVSAGATALTFASGPTGWLAGDRLVLTDTRLREYDKFDTGSSDYIDNGQHEERLISSVSGTTVNLTAATTYSHLGARDRSGTVDFYPAVANVTRNVVIRSATPTATTKLHCLAHGRCEVDVQYVEIKNAGRSKLAAFDDTLPTNPSSGSVTHVGTNQRGRYPWHFHHCLGPLGLGAEVPQFKFVGNAVWSEQALVLDEVRRWGITIHGSHYGLVQDNVVYRVAGSGIVEEDGDSTQTEVVGNWVAFCQPTGSIVNSRGGIDVAHEGSAYWFRGVDLLVRDNWCGNCGHGYIIAPYMQSGTIKIPAYKGADPYSGDPAQYEVVDGKTRVLAQFDNNEVGGRTIQGMQIWKLGTPGGTGADNPDMALSTINDYKAWHLSEFAYYNYMTVNLTFDGAIIRGDFTKLRAAQGSTQLAFFTSDYVMAKMAVKNSSIQGCYAGITVNFTYGVDPILLQGNTWSNYVDISVIPPWAAFIDVSGDTGTELSNREIQIIDSVHLDPLVSHSAWGTQYYVGMYGAVGNYSSALIRGNNTVVLTNWNGTTTDYQLYFPEQAGSAVLAQTVQEGAVSHSGTAQAGSASTLTLASGASGTDNFYVNKRLWLTGGTGSGQGYRLITAYNGTTKVATVSPSFLLATPDNTTTYEVRDAGRVFVLGGYDAGQTNTFHDTNYGIKYADAITPGGTVTLSRVLGDALQL